MLPLRARQTIAWLGGLAFVASLAYFVHFYTLIETPPAQATASLPASVLIDVALFTVFALHHSVLARTTLKQRIARLVGPDLERASYVWIASALFFIVCYGWQRLPVDFVITYSGPWLWISRGIQIAGLAIIVFAMRSIDPLELAGIRQVLRRPPRWGPPVVPPISFAFPYNIVRHPIYLGWILTTFGASPVTADRLLFAGLGAAYLVMAIPWEERSLIGAFGEEYRRYQARVGWRVIPGLY